MTLRKGYSHLKEDALDRTMWRARFGRGFGPVVRQTAKLMTTKPVLTRFHVPLNMTLYVVQSYFVIHESNNTGIPISVVECHSTV